MQLVVGVDGGNTKTIAVVSDAEGRSTGVGRGGCGNWEAMGAQRAAETITGVIEEALKAAGGRREDVVHAHMGLAGQDWPDDEPRMQSALREAGWQCPLTLENDAFSPLRASAPEGHGIGVTAGTGIAAGIVRPDGERYFYGAFTDMGGGGNINGGVLHAVIRSEDGRGRPTALTPALLEATGHATATDLVYDMHRRGYQPSSSVLRPILFRAARMGDPAAVAVVTDFGRELALCATNLIRRYRLEGEDTAVVAAGTLFVKTGPLLFEVFRDEVLATAPRARTIRADRPPVMGALRGALMARGWDTPEVWTRLNEAATDEGWFQDDAEPDREAAEDGG